MVQANIVHDEAHLEVGKNSTATVVSGAQVDYWHYAEDFRAFYRCWIFVGKCKGPEWQLAMYGVAQIGPDHAHMWAVDVQDPVFWLEGVDSHDAETRKFDDYTDWKVLER